MGNKIKRRVDIVGVDRRLKEYKIGLYVIFSLFIVLASIFFIFIHSYNNIYYEAPRVILKGNLSLSQIEFVNGMIKDLKPLYYHSVRSFTFTSDREEVAGSLKSNVNRVGYTDKFGNVYLYLTDDLEFDRQALCHEISHNFLMGLYERGINRNNLEEDYAYDLMYTKFCFYEGSYNRCSYKEATYNSYYSSCQFFDNYGDGHFLIDKGYYYNLLREARGG